MLRFNEKPSLVLPWLKRIPAVQIGAILMLSETWCPAPVDDMVAKVKRAPTVRAGLEIARSTGYGRKSVD